MAKNSSKIKIYGLKNCDSCRKVYKHVSSKHDNTELIDVREQPIKKTQMSTWCKQFGRDTLVNRRSTTWRQLNDQQKELPSDAQAIDLLLEYPSLMKRPVITKDKNAMLGNKLDEIDAFLVH